MGRYDPYQKFTVVQEVPKALRDIGFVAYVQDSHHPDGINLSCSWHQSLDDAYRVAQALNNEEPE